MDSDLFENIIEKLNKLTVPYFLENMLDNDYTNQEVIPERSNKIDRLNDKLEKFAQIRNTDPVSIGEPHNENTNFKEIALEARIYFEQAIELFKSSRNVSELTSPLYEYYGFIQCIKGVILGSFKVSEHKFFSYHGITCRLNSSSDLEIDVKNYGVFQALIIHYDPLSSLETYFGNNYQKTLNDFFHGYRYIQNSGLPPDSLIGSFFLSNLVRYYPKYWQSILFGQDSDIIINIRNFLATSLPIAILDLLKSINILKRDF